MADEVQIRGAEQLAELGKKLKAADETELRQDLRRNIRASVKPLTQEMKASLRAGLPKRGGLAALMGTASIGVRVSTEGRGVGVRILAQKRDHDLASIDKGIVRHPTYGRKPWRTQQVKPLLLTTPFQNSEPRVRAGVLKAMDQTATKITS